MRITDEAVEAGARAILRGATIDSFYSQGDWEAAGYDVQQSMRKAASDALDAALAILHPTVPNTADALDVLPRGTVLRGEDHEGTPWLVSLASAFDSAQSVPYWRSAGIDSWRVLWMPEQDQPTHSPRRKTSERA